MKLSVKAWTITLALLSGIYLFLAALLASLNINLMIFNAKSFKIYALFFPGITPTFIGAIVSLFYGLVFGAFFGLIFTLLHNWVLNISCKFCKK